ncbi:MAG: LAGLIDADG family homing endonuclease [Candidatus Woesearchaeota archaeon]
METLEQIEQIKEFLQKYYHAHVLEAIRQGVYALHIDFQTLSKFNPQIATYILDNPEEFIEKNGIFEKAIEQFDIDVDPKKFHFRFSNLTPKEQCLIRNLRSNHLNKLLFLEGTVRQKSDVRPKMISATFECPSCGNTLKLSQNEEKIRTPVRCPNCQYKGKFRLMDKELVDSQGMVLEEISSDLEGGEQPKRLKIYLESDLVSPITEKKTNPGTNIRVTGVLREVELPAKGGGKLTKYDYLYYGNYIESLSEDYLDIKITKEEEKELQEMAKDPNFRQKLIESSAPGIYGHEIVKEAILMQFVGGVQKKRPDGVKNRGDIHILLIGDPGSGKCVTANTLVTLSDGTILPIQKIAEHSQNEFTPVQIQVPSIQLDGTSGTSTATKFWKRYVDESVLKITLRSGKELEVTKNHPLFESINGQVVAKHASEFTVGDYIATPRSISTNGSYQLLEYTHKKYSNNTKNQTYPQLLNHRIARFIGYLTGDGCLRKTKTTGYVGLTTQSYEIFGDVCSILKTEFELSPSIRKKINTFELYCSGENTLAFFSKNFTEITQKANKKTIPQKILQSPNSILSQFIKGLFDCDAYVNKSKRQIEYCTISKQLAKELQLALLRFGVISLLKHKRKHATNTIEKKKIDAYELIIPRFSCQAYAQEIGFTVQYKASTLKHILTLPQNTNIDVIPNIGHLFSSESVPRQTRAHYMKGTRLPSRTVAKNAGIPLASANIFWDKITRIESVPYKGFVYDFEVEQTHNFIANGVVVHNSQLLKRASVFAPKARYVSGKGASAAGLCVSPNSLVNLNPGAMTKIKDVVEPRLTNPTQYRPGILKQENVGDITIQSLSENLKIQSKKPQAIWKLDAPQYLISVQTQTGKEIELTANTQLLCLEDGQLKWIESKNICENQYIATPKKLIGGNVTNLFTVSLIKSNPVVHFVKPFVKSLIETLQQTNKTKRSIAQELQVNENQLYHHWINEKAAGNIKLWDLKKIAKLADTQYETAVKIISLYNGKKHTIPTYISPEFLYVCGLLAGDGDIAKKANNTYAVRLSNSQKILLDAYKKILTREFQLPFDEQPATSIRPASVRTTSKILAEILFSLGMCVSPKSDKICFSDTLLHFTNDYLAHYIAGLYDADGSIYLREGKVGSDSIELTTTSSQLAKQLQLVLLRYELRATIRKRPASRGTINGKHQKYVIEIRGHAQLQTFAKTFSLKHPEKQKKLQKILTTSKKSHSNLTQIPNVAHIIKKELQEQKISLRKAQWHPTISRNKCIEIIKSLKHRSQKIEELLQILTSDIVFEKVVKKKEISCNFDYVYDLTVEKSHNFVVDGILVHNTASVIKDDFMGGWALEAGALVLANRGICMIDELDKMTTEDRSAMHEALEQQSVTVAKANIQATLMCETTVLAAANPKMGRFDPFENIAKQIDLPPALINRFDLIFPFRDLPNEEGDERLATFVLGMHQRHANKEPELSTDKLKKFIIYARKNIFPTLTDSALQELKTYYVKMRNANKGEDSMTAISLSARQLEALVRMTEANARLRLSQKATVKDARKAIEMLDYCLSQIGVDPETGRVDIDRIQTGFTTSQRSKVINIREIIKELEEKEGKIIPVEKVYDLASQKGMSEEKVEEALERLKLNGDIFEPKRGFISRIL